VDNPGPLPLRDRQAGPAFSESLANLTVPPYSSLWRKSQGVCARRCQPAESGPRLFGTRETPSPATRRWSARRGRLNFPGGTSGAMIAITGMFCDSSHWGNSWTSRPGRFDDNATDRTAVGEFFDALVHDVGDVQSLLLACRIARRLDRAGFAGGPRRHRLVLNSRRRVSPRRTRSCGARGDGAGLPTDRPASRTACKWSERTS